MNSPGYLTVETFTPEEFCKRLNGMENSPELSADTAFESIQIVEKDSAGYVSQVKVGEEAVHRGGDPVRSGSQILRLLL